MIKRFFKFFISRFFLVNTTLSLIALLSIFYYTMSHLDDYTNHGVKIAVPILVGVQIQNVEDSLADLELRFEIRDSVYSDQFPTGMVIQQDPLPNTEKFMSYVKPNRRIYLTIVKKQDSTKAVPDLLSRVTSKTIGKKRLELLGFKVELELKDHKDRDKVLQVLFNGSPIKAGQRIPKGATLTLVYGTGSKGKPIELPIFKGMNIEIAKLKANEIGLELDVHYDDTLMSADDSLRAVIYNQYPDPESGQSPYISIGSIVLVDANLSTTLDSLFISDTTSNQLPIE